MACRRCNGTGSYLVAVNGVRARWTCETCWGSGDSSDRNAGPGCFSALFWLVAGVVAVCGLLFIFVLPRFDGQPPGSGTPGESNLARLDVGDCYVEGAQPYQVIETSCTDDHDGEVLAAFPADIDVYYTDQRIDAECLARFSRTVRDMLARQELRPNTMLDVPGDRLFCTVLRGVGEPPLTGRLR